MTTTSSWSVTAWLTRCLCHSLRPPCCSFVAWRKAFEQRATFNLYLDSCFLFSLFVWLHGTGLICRLWLHHSPQYNMGPLHLTTVEKCQAISVFLAAQGFWDKDGWIGSSFKPGAPVLLSHTVTDFQVYGSSLFPACRALNCTYLNTIHWGLEQHGAPGVHEDEVEGKRERGRGGKKAKQKKKSQLCLSTNDLTQSVCFVLPLLVCDSWAMIRSLRGGVCMYNQPVSSWHRVKISPLQNTLSSTSLPPLPGCHRRGEKKDSMHDKQSTQSFQCFFLLFLWMFVTDTLACVGTFSRLALKLQIDLSS